MSAVEVVGVVVDPVSQSGVFLGEVVSFGVVELSGQVIDPCFSSLDLGAQ